MTAFLCFCLETLSFFPIVSPFSFCYAKKLGVMDPAAPLVLSALCFRHFFTSVVQKKLTIWCYDTWLISQQFTCRDLKPVVFLVFFNTCLYKSAFSNLSFGKLVFLSFCVFCGFVHFICFEFDAYRIYNICYNAPGAPWFCSHFVKTDCKNLVSYHSNSIIAHNRS